MSIDERPIEAPEDVEVSQLAVDLTNALARLDELGWTQAGNPALSGKVCAYLAITDAADYDYARQDTALSFFAALIGGCCNGDIWTWNDDRTRTLADVRGAFVRAIEAAS